MSLRPREEPNGRLQCRRCAAPVVKTTDREYVCVDCGEPAE